MSGLSRLNTSNSAPIFLFDLFAETLCVNNCKFFTSSIVKNILNAFDLCIIFQELQ
ncbi:hypothetical protein HNP38_002433 [Chryseobacterium defluvii]|uniref:Uncharacterized protein n=1 Tax=Chryseobacterium defluvii TaxID=160396 RepID=A0A840KCD8_9FLAO|nr:hypothetical protein [Chryseobacterium defluvii]